jgi:hydrogenase nickel incorporation protein HypA/HybF
MHEAAIVEALITEVQKQVASAGCQGRVVKLRLRIGRFSGVSPEALRFAFDLTKPGTLLAEAELEIEEPSALCVCTLCGQRTPVDDLVVACPVCGSGQIHLEGGQEMLLESIELQEASEMPDPPSPPNPE